MKRPFVYIDRYYEEAKLFTIDPYYGETILFTIDPFYGNLISFLNKNPVKALGPCPGTSAKATEAPSSAFGV